MDLGYRAGWKEASCRLIAQSSILGVLQVSQALSVAFGGSPDASVAEVVAKLTRAKAGRTYASPREALLLNVKFVISQLQASGTCSAAAPFIARIQSEVRGQL